MTAPPNDVARPRPDGTSLTWRGVEFVSRYTEVNGLRMHRLEATVGAPPAGRAILLIHSLTSHAHSWLPTVARMHAGRFICPDLRGHGFTDWTRAGYWLADYAADITAVAAEVEVDAIDVVAPSLGGRVAALVAPQLGARLNQVVLLDSAPEVSAVAAQRVQSIRTSTESRSSFTDTDQVRAHWTAQHADWDPETIDVRSQYLYRRNWAGRLVSRNDPEAGFFFGTAGTTEQDAVWAALAATLAPVTIVRARDSYLLDDELADRVRAAAPNGHRRDVEGGHYLCYESPARLAALLDDLLGAI